MHRVKRQSGTGEEVDKRWWNLKYESGVEAWITGRMVKPAPMARNSCHGDHPATNQHGRVDGCSRNGVADREQDNLDDYGHPAAEDVRRLAHKRHHGRGGKEVRISEPHVLLLAVQLSYDPRQRGGDNSGI